MPAGLNRRLGRSAHPGGGQRSVSPESVSGLDLVFGVICVLVGGLVGVAMGLQGPEALIPVGVGVAVLILIRPVVGVLLFAASIPVQSLFVVGAGVTATRVVGMVVFGAWAANKVLRGESFRRVVASRLFVVGAAFVAFALASSLWASVPTAAVAGSVQLVQLYVWALIVIDFAPTWQRAEMLVRAFIVGGIIAALLTLQQYFFGGLTRAGDEITGGVNATAVMLVTLVPFGFYLFRSSRAEGWRACGFAYVAVAVVAVTLTFSRMNMLVLPALLVALTWETLRGTTGRGWMVALLSAGCVLGALLVPWERVQERAGTIGPYIERTVGNGSALDRTSSGRGYHWKVGLAIGRDHPIAGAGFRNYGELFRSRYQFTVPGSDRVYQSRRNPHSAHIGMFADLGLVGLCLWLALLVGVGVRSVTRAWRATRFARASRAHLLVRALAYSVFLHVFAFGWYAATDQDKLFWALLGMTVVVAELTAQRPGATNVSRTY
jgi:hypothetical protein